MSNPFSLFTHLEGPHLRLDRLETGDKADLFTSLMSESTWPVVERGIKNESMFNDYLDGFLARQERGEGLTLVSRVTASSKLAAISTFWNLDPKLTKVEIGFTWVADRWMRTFVNTEQKYLMLNYAFETIGVKRVEFSVAPKNEKSNAAMKRLGAVHEGMLRKWRFLSASDNGDRNIYSIIDDDWAVIKPKLWARISDSTNPIA